jgi:hypothetical protein
MHKHWIFRVVGIVLLLIGIAVVAGLAYSAGLAQTFIPPAAETAPVVNPHWFAGPHGHGLFALPFLLCLAPIFLGLFICLPLRLVFGHGPRPMHMHRFGRCGEGEVPEPLREMHRRLHETEKTDTPS